jgi:hypothetical protein
MTIDKLISFNFHFSVWFSIIGGVWLLNFPDFIVPAVYEMYGPLSRNFMIVVGYLVFSQVGLWYLRYLKGSRLEALFMGCTFVLTATGAEFYGMVNSLPVNDRFALALTYVGLSHGLYYLSKVTRGNAAPA